MKNIKSTPFLLILILALLCFASCNSSTARIADTLEAKAPVDTLNSREFLGASSQYKAIRAQHVNSDIITNVVVHKNDNFQSGDTVWTKFNPEDNCLDIVYNYPVDHTNSVGLSMFKVKIL